MSRAQSNHHSLKNKQTNKQKRILSISHRLANPRLNRQKKRHGHIREIHSILSLIDTWKIQLQPNLLLTAYTNLGGVVSSYLKKLREISQIVFQLGFIQKRFICLFIYLSIRWSVFSFRIFSTPCMPLAKEDKDFNNQSWFWRSSPKLKKKKKKKKKK